MTDPAPTEDDYVVATGRERLRSGRRAMAHARYLVDVEGKSPEAEAKARSALVTLRSAMDWLEDTPMFEEAHQQLDDAGRFVRETFGCTLPFENDTYWQECPVALAHNRVGLSPAMVIGSAECSICRRDPEDDACVHVRGRVYDGERCIRIINKVDRVLEVSFVGRPAQPDARISRMSMNTSRLAAELGERFKPGMPVNCDRCLLRCAGITRPFEGRDLDRG